jgi:hypothetical protein
MKLLLVTAAIGGLIAPATAGADYYRYTTENGATAWTDDLKRVPARYRDQVETIAAQDLESYSRLTIVPRGATSAPSLPEPEAEVIEPEAPDATKTPMRFEVSPGVTIEPEPDGGPIIVRKNRTRWIDGTARPLTIIEQDGKILAEIEQY